jgi:methionine-rich copper-binding protein CopC
MMAHSHGTGRGHGLAFLLCLIVSFEVAAHARLVKSVPADDAELSTVPGAVVLTFNESPEHSFSSVQLLDAAGTLVETPALGRGDTPDSLVLPLPAALPAGAYTVKYRVLSVDGHVVEGRLVFRISAKPAR